MIKNKLSAIFAIITIMLSVTILQGKSRIDTKDHSTKNAEFPSAAGVGDRSYNVIDVNMLGQYVSNMGQFYSSWNEVVPEGEWPLGSGHAQMYRMNVYIGVPGNVIQTRTYGTKEWDPVWGFNNPSTFLPVSNDTSTWPLDGSGNKYWPVQDGSGNPVIVSDMDSYAVYQDSTNYLYISTGDPSKMLNIVVHQTSYAWNTSLDNDYIIFKFQVVNNSSIPKDSLYFCMYSDFDIGGFDDYDDDLIGLDTTRNFYYFYDANNFSPEWNAPTFHFGGVFLETPEVAGEIPGLTDFHYTGYYEEPASISDDSIQFGLMSSSEALRADSIHWPNLFHGNNLHIDDVSLIPVSGMDLVCFPSSGPYEMGSYDTLTFIFALVAGEDYNDISENVDRIWDVYNSNWQVKAVPQPVITAVTGNNLATLNWSNVIDNTYIDVYNGRNDLFGYLIYKTEDPTRTIWGAPIDTVHKGETSPLNPSVYSWLDYDVLNGFFYSYAVTAFDSSYLDSTLIPPIVYESGIANVNAGLNTVEVRPESNPSVNMGKIRVVPNPYVISAGWERERLGNIPEGEPIRELSFTNLPPECTIKIFSLDGDLIKTLHHTDGTGTEYWDIRSDYNQMAATGIYFYYVKWSGGEHTDKLAIIR